MVLVLLSRVSEKRNAARLFCITLTWPISLLTLFAFRGSFLLQGRFSFVNLMHRMIVDIIETDLSLKNTEHLCDGAGIKTVVSGPVLRKHLHKLPWKLGS